MLAECCVFIKQSQPPFFCNPFALLQATGAYLIPKLRYKFAEFLLPSSLKRLRILISPTCVGLRYGLVELKLRGFSWDHCRLLPEQAQSSQFLEFRSRICLRAFLKPPTGTSNTRLTIRDPSPHRTQQRCRNINLLPIDYAFLPRLRGRLTLRR